MELSPDSVTVFEIEGWIVNATLVCSWVVTAMLVVVSAAVTRGLRREPPVPRWQGMLEVIVEGTRGQIRDIWPRHPDRFVPFVGTLFLYISLSGLLAVVPGFRPPTGSLSTTAALALAVFLAVPFYGVLHRGAAGFLKSYLKPTPLMLPFNLIGEVSRTVALAVRLFGNMMSGAMLLAVLLVIAPLFFPVLVHLLELLISQVQAYIFAVLAMVYIASAAAVHDKEEPDG